MSSTEACNENDLFVLYYLKSLDGIKINMSAWDTTINACHLQDSNGSDPHLNNFIGELDITDMPDIDPTSSDHGFKIFAYATPFIIILGLLGNIVSLRVFASGKLRKLSASLYLAAISVSDSLVLVIYVLIEWLHKGLYHWPGSHRLSVVSRSNGLCQSFLFFAYLWRFVSVWLIVIFTVERYIAACRPLQRRVICTKSFGRKAIGSTLLLGALVSLYKPLLSGVYNVDTAKSGDGNSTHLTDFLLLRNNSNSSSDDALYRYYCTGNPRYMNYIFFMELCYQLSITAVPFMLIAIFNTLILKTIIRRDTAIRRWKLSLKENRIRWEFTVMLLVVSTAFICLNLPYCTVWLQQFRQTESALTSAPPGLNHTRNQLYLTKTIFSLNYCINFFFYCLTGTYYRRELRRVVCCGKWGDSSRPPSCHTAVTSLKEVHCTTL